MSYTVNLQVFQGPLDLLLKLIDEKKIDIYDIPIAIITEQYLEYLSGMTTMDLDILADFILMAATLIRIKSRMLVPRYEVVESESEDEEEDPRQELVRKLVEYRQFKLAANTLMQMQEGLVSRVYYREDEIIDEEIELKASLPQLLKAFKVVWQQKEDDSPIFEIPGGDIDINEKMKELLERLERNGTGLILQELFDSTISKREALALFLALLELTRQGKVLAIQSELFGPIKVLLTRG